MLFKDIDSKDKEITQLKNLLKLSQNPKQQTLIKADLTRIENGYKAEKENAYYLDFGFKDSPRNIILHDIRIEHKGKVAQIDHIIINRLGIEVLESKSFTGTLTIKGDGSLDVKYGKKVQTFPNPIEQNKRHAEILSDFIKANMKLPSNYKLFGIPISSTVLINPKTTIASDTLPKGFDRADSFTTHWDEKVNKMSTISVFKTLGTLIKMDKVKEIATFLLKHHQPKTYDYAKKYPIKKEQESINKPTVKSTKKLCSKCNSDDIEIIYGKYGYYFKCHSCRGNTAIKLICSNSKCKPKIKKSKLNFYHVCETCGKTELFFKNKEKVF
jgi:hypothetical protein